MPRSTTTRVGTRLAFRRVPCCLLQDGGHRHPKLVFAAQWLAYALPCQRFAPILADRCA
jgi:hypothetical protein